MPDNDHIMELSNYRLSKADKNIEAARLLLESKYYRDITEIRQLDGERRLLRWNE